MELNQFWDESLNVHCFPTIPPLLRCIFPTGKGDLHGYISYFMGGYISILYIYYIYIIYLYIFKLWILFPDVATWTTTVVPFNPRPPFAIAVSRFAKRSSAIMDVFGSPTGLDASKESWVFPRNVVVQRVRRVETFIVPTKNSWHFFLVFQGINCDADLC